MSVASFSAGHVESAYAMHLPTPQSSSERTRCFASTILQSSRAQLIVLALFWELDSSRGFISAKHAFTGDWMNMFIRSRLTGGMLVLQRVSARAIQASANAVRARWGSSHGSLHQGLRGADR